MLTPQATPDQLSAYALAIAPHLTTISDDQARGAVSKAGEAMSAWLANRGRSEKPAESK